MPLTKQQRFARAATVAHGGLKPLWEAFHRNAVAAAESKDAPNWSGGGAQNSTAASAQAAHDEAEHMATEMGAWAIGDDEPTAGTDVPDAAEDTAASYAPVPPDDDAILRKKAAKAAWLCSVGEKRKAMATLGRTSLSDGRDPRAPRGVRTQDAEGTHAE